MEIQLVVRDDGSTDNTVEILEDYEKKGSLKLIRGKNVGFKNSFMIALQSCKESDYYAFSDQDDVWMKEKLFRTVSTMNRCDIPELGFCNAYFTDPDLKPYKLAKESKTNIPSKEMCFSMCVASGYLIVINSKLKKLLDITGTNIPVSHDVWAGAVASYVGNVIFVNEVLALHRRLPNSVSRTNLFKLFINRLGALLYDKGVNIPCAEVMLDNYMEI